MLMLVGSCKGLHCGSCQNCMSTAPDCVMRYSVVIADLRFAFALSPHCSLLTTCMLRGTMHMLVSRLNRIYFILSLAEFSLSHVSVQTGRFGGSLFVMVIIKQTLRQLTRPASQTLSLWTRLMIAADACLENWLAWSAGGMPFLSQPVPAKSTGRTTPAARQRLRVKIRRSRTFTR